MTQEMWINTQSDWSEFLSFIRDEKLTPNVQGKDPEGNYLVKAGDYIVHVPHSYELPKKEEKTLLGQGLLNAVKDITTAKSYDPLIFGKDPTPNIVNITVDNDQVFIYKSDGSSQVRDYQNWALGAYWDEGCQRLKGHQFYKYIKDLPEDQFYMLKDSWNPKIWTPRTASEGFMLRSGMTYYKGMKVSDVSLLSFDLEATTLDKDSPDAYVPLVSTTYRSKTGEIHKRLFDVFDYQNHESMLLDINFYISERNPDVILGHNILGYDLPYLDKNSTKEGLEWGRDGSRIIFDEKVSKKRKDGSQQYEYFNAFINGREIIDTFFLALTYDIGRELPSYGLKAIEKYYGWVKEDRSWDFQKWSVAKLIEAKKAGNHEIWQKFREYCQDDSDSPIKMFDMMIPSFFYLCQSVPKTLQQMVNEASGSQLDSLMIRSYLQNGHSLPRSSRKEEFEGAISMGVVGNYKNVRKVDVASLYPSIMLEYDIYDKKKDPERNMLKMLEYFRNERLANKKLAKETNEKYYDDLQNSQKIVINSMYGFLGAGYLLFNYPEGAAEVTKHGREILLKGVQWATGHTLAKVVKKVVKKGKEDEESKYHWVIGEKVCEGLGYQLVNVDTDSFSYTNNILPTKEEFDRELQDLNSLYPKLISWEKDGKDGIFDKIIVVGAKNYVLVRDGKVKYKGSSLTDQKKEPRLLILLETLIQSLLDDKTDQMLDIYNQACREVVSDFKVKEWVTKKTVTEAVLSPKRANEQGPLDAINEAIAKKVINGIQEGDKIWLYVALDGEKQKMAKGEPVVLKSGVASMVPNDIYRFPELYNKDQYTEYYLERVWKTASILDEIIDISKFPKYHSSKGKKLIEELK